MSPACSTWSATAPYRLLATQTIQPKLEVGPADDAYEQEADQMAEQVMRMPAPGSQHAPPADTPAEDETLQPARLQRAELEEDEDDTVQLSRLQRAELEAGEDEDETIRAKSDDGRDGFTVNSDFEQRLGATRGAGSPLPGPTRNFMESRFDADFSAVRLHTGSELAQLNREVSAQAFTRGADIYLGAGKENLASGDGQRLLAHELTHTLQQGAARLRRSPQPPIAGAIWESQAGGVIRRKLAGVAEAVVQMGGEPSIKSKMKSGISQVTSLVKGNDFEEGSGKYAHIISSLKDYEKLEVKLRAKNQNDLSQKEKSELWGSLKMLEQLVVSWLDQYGDLAVTPEQATQLLKEKGTDQIISEESQGRKRYHALRMLLPRLVHEQMEINTGQFYKTQSWSDKSLDKSKSKDDAFGGKVNRLDKVTHQGQEGVFIQEGTWADPGTVGSKLGISVPDPNAGARSVAMYQLAKLLDLGVNVIAKTEFATHTSVTHKQDEPHKKALAKMGVRMEMATGSEAAKTTTALTDQESQQMGGNTVSLEDPVLQRSLNALQLIDAIAGQLDRHWHNYYIATDGNGHVTGVVGIDLDMAFAPDHKTVLPTTENQDDPLRGAHFVGMPKLVDSAFAQRIVSIQPKQIEDLLKLYLTPSEVASTVIRFNLVKDACQKISGAPRGHLAPGLGLSNLPDPTLRAGHQLPQLHGLRQHQAHLRRAGQCHCPDRHQAHSRPPAVQGHFGHRRAHAVGRQSQGPGSVGPDQAAHRELRRQARPGAIAAHGKPGRHRHPQLGPAAHQPGATRPGPGQIRLAPRLPPGGHSGGHTSSGPAPQRRELPCGRETRRRDRPSGPKPGNANCPAAAKPGDAIGPAAPNPATRVASIAKKSGAAMRMRIAAPDFFD